MIEQSASEAVRYPLFEGTLFRMRHELGAEVVEGYEGGFDHSEIPENVLDADGIVEEPVAVVDAGESRTFDEVVPEGPVPEFVHFLRLGEEPVTAEVEAVPLVFERLADAADERFLLDDDDGFSFADEATGRGESGGSGSENDGVDVFHSGGLLEDESLSHAEIPAEDDHDRDCLGCHIAERGEMRDFDEEKKKERAEKESTYSDEEEKGHLLSPVVGRPEDPGDREQIVCRDAEHEADGLRDEVMGAEEALYGIEGAHVYDRGESADEEVAQQLHGGLVGAAKQDPGYDVFHARSVTKPSGCDRCQFHAVRTISSIDG